MKLAENEVIKTIDEINRYLDLIGYTMGNNEMVLKILKKKIENNHLKLPSDMEFEIEEGTMRCRIVLNVQKMKDENMQGDDKAFEAWAIAMHIVLDESGIIILDADGEINGNPDDEKGHWYRFLYRALRFSEQYGDWFKLSERIEVLVRNFKEYLENNCFINNVPCSEAKTKDKPESRMEEIFSQNGKLKNAVGSHIGDNEVNRQLPVGLFHVEESINSKKNYNPNDKNRIFTGRSSAIDLWTWNGDEFFVIELKADENNKMGIISELFFYSNYMYDFLVRKSFMLSEPSNHRGYSNILEHKDEFKKVCGIMLADEFHSIIEDERVLDVLNDNNMGDTLKYEKATYNMADYL